MQPANPDPTRHSVRRPVRHATGTLDLVVLTGLTATATDAPTAADAATSAMSQIDHALGRAGLGWTDLRVLTVQLEGDLPGDASWRLLADRRST